MRLHQVIRLFPDKQIHHQILKSTLFPQFLIHRLRIVRRRHAVVLLAQSHRLINNRIPQSLHLQLIGQRVQSYESKKGGVLGLNFFMGKALGVDPLLEELEVVGADFGEVDAAGYGFGEAVLLVPGGAEEGRGRGKDVAVDGEFDFLFADVNGCEFLVECSGWCCWGSKELWALGGWCGFPRRAR